MKQNKPKIGTTCPSLTNEYYGYKLSGDAYENCQCNIFGKLCVGIEIIDDENQSSQFSSRGRCSLVQSEIENCKFYGMSKEFHTTIIKEIAAAELKKKLNNIK